MDIIKLEGKIKYDYNDKYDRILLIDKDGFIIDLVARVREIKMSFMDKLIQVCYWISDDFCTKDKMIEGFLEKIYGSQIKADYEDNGYTGSEWTGHCPSYDTELSFSGHNFMRELRDEEDRFIIIEFNVQI